MTDPHAEASGLVKEVIGHLEDYDGDWTNAGKLAEVLRLLNRLSAREKCLRELLLALVDAGVIRGQWAKTIRVALSKDDSP